MLKIARSFPLGAHLWFTCRPVFLFMTVGWHANIPHVKLSVRAKGHIKNMVNPTVRECFCPLHCPLSQREFELEEPIKAILSGRILFAAVGQLMDAYCQTILSRLSDQEWMVNASLL